MPDSQKPRTVVIKNVKDLLTILILSATKRTSELKNYVDSLEADSRKCSAPQEDVALCNVRSPRMVQ